MFDLPATYFHLLQSIFMHHEYGLIIALVSIIGGMLLAAFFVLPQHYKERLMMLDNQSKERLAMIEKGMEPSLAEKKKKPGSDALLWGLLLAGVGFGGFLGYFIAHAYSLSNGVLMHASGFFFGGLGLIIYYLVQRKGDKRPT